MRKTLLLFCLVLLGVARMTAATPLFEYESGKKYYIACEYTEGFVAIGASHNVAYELYYVNSTSVTADGYWYIEQSGDGYTIKNASTGDYLAWTDTYNQYCKYLTLQADVDDNAIWYINNIGNQHVTIQSVAYPSYYWNLRTGTHLMGCYAGGIGTNGHFNIYAEGDGDSGESGGESGGGESGGTPGGDSSWSSSKTYVIHNVNDFGYIVYNPDVITTAPVIKGFTSTTRKCANDAFREDMDDTDPNNLWRVEMDDNGKYAFFNIGKQQYMYVSSNLTFSSSRYFSFSDTPTYFTAIEQKEGVYVFSYTVQTNGYGPGGYSYSTTYYLCDAPQQDAGTTILLYTDISDVGSQFELVEAYAGERVTIRDLVLDYSAIKMPLGKTYTLPVSITPTDATNKSLNWSSSNISVATVSSTGLITAVGTGSTIITATTKDGSQLSVTCEVEVYEPQVTTPTTDLLYVHQASGAMDAFPLSSISTRTDGDDGSLTIKTVDNNTYSYAATELVSVTEDAPTDLPTLTSYKFNNKYNNQLLVDVVAEEELLPDGSLGIPETISLTVGNAIGKRLTASFNASTEDATVYVNGIEQVSKKTRMRFDHDIVYIVAPRAYKVYTSTVGAANIYDISNPSRPVVIVADDAQSSYEWMPYGRTYTVHVDWATDNPTGAYNVPTVYITLDDGAYISSINKTSYIGATIRVDGAGVYPDLAEMAVSIKGRGNSSWGGSTSSTKNPFRLKFDTKQKLLGMRSGKSWVLLANKQTGSMTTNALAFKMADMVQSAGCNHIVPVELYINDEYRGSYNVTEKVGFSNNSIDLVDESEAFMLELDTYSDETYYTDNAYGVATKIHEPDLDDILDDTERQNLIDAILLHWKEFTYAVYSNDNFESWMDVDAFVRGMFVIDLSRNQELKHPKSTFFYNEHGVASDGLGGFTLNYESPYVYGPVWDFDWAYGYDGTYRYFIDSAETDIFSSSGKGTPFFRQLLRSSETIQKAYYALWHDFMTNGGLEELLEYCDEYYEFASPSLVHNATKWGDGTQYETQTANAKTWLAARAAYIYNNLTAYDISEQEAAQGPGTGDANDDGTITTADVVAIINNILGIPNENFNIRQADTDGNDLVTMRDASAVTQMVMEQQSSLTRHLRLPAADAAIRPVTFVAAVGEEARMPLALTIAEGDYSALQFDVTVPDGMQFIGVTLPDNLSGYATTTSRLDNRNYRVSIYAGSGNPLPAGTSTLQLSFIADELIAEDARLVSVTSAMLVDADAEDNRLGSVSVRFHMPDETTAIERLTARQQSAASATEVFDLQGRRVVSPQQGGVYIIGGKKVMF